MKPNMRRAVVAALLTIAAAMPVSGRADGLDPADDPNSVHKLFGYASCAVAIVGASTGVLIAAAVVTCALVLTEEAGV